MLKIHLLHYFFQNWAQKEDEDEDGEEEDEEEEEKEEEEEEEEEDRQTCLCFVDMLPLYLQNVAAYYGRIRACQPAWNTSLLHTTWYSLYGPRRKKENLKENSEGHLNL